MVSVLALKRGLHSFCCQIFDRRQIFSGNGMQCADPANSKHRQVWSISCNCCRFFASENVFVQCFAAIKPRIWGPCAVSAVVPSVPSRWWIRRGKKDLGIQIFGDLCRGIVTPFFMWSSLIPTICGSVDSNESRDFRRCCWPSAGVRLSAFRILRCDRKVSFHKSWTYQI